MSISKFPSSSAPPLSTTALNLGRRSSFSSSPTPPSLSPLYSTASSLTTSQNSAPISAAPSHSSLMALRRVLDGSSSGEKDSPGSDLGFKLNKPTNLGLRLRSSQYATQERVRLSWLDFKLVLYLACLLDFR